MLRLQVLKVSFMERIRLVVWRQPEGDRDWCTKTWGTEHQREPGRRSGTAGEARYCCWGGQEEEGQTITSIFPCAGVDFQREACLWCRLWRQGTTCMGDRTPPCELWMARHLFCGLRAVEGAKHHAVPPVWPTGSGRKPQQPSWTRGGHGPPPLEFCE